MEFDILFFVFTQKRLKLTDLCAKTQFSEKEDKQTIFKCLEHMLLLCDVDGLQYRTKYNILV